MDQIAKSKNIVSFIGGGILLLLGFYIATATKFTIAGKEDPGNAKPVSTPVKLLVGISILLIGTIIIATHWNSSKSE